MQEVIFICILSLITYADIKERRIPNVLLLLSIMVKLVGTLLQDEAQLYEILGIFGNALAVSLPLWLLVALMDRILGKKTMGGGDIKLVFVTGMYLGWEQNLLMLFVAGIIALSYVLVRKEKEIPFGPAIAIATVLIMILERIG